MSGNFFPLIFLCSFISKACLYYSKTFKVSKKSKMSQSFFHDFFGFMLAVFIPKKTDEWVSSKLFKSNWNWTNSSPLQNKQIIINDALNESVIFHAIHGFIMAIKLFILFCLPFNMANISMSAECLFLGPIWKCESTCVTWNSSQVYFSINHFRINNAEINNNVLQGKHCCSL